MISQSPKHLFCMTMLLFLLSLSLPTCDALSLSGTAFQDADGDGFFSPNEQPAPNIAITLSQEGNALSTAATNESGQYSFENLSPGRYELTAKPFSGSLLTVPGAGSYAVTLSDMSASGLDWGLFLPGNASYSFAPRTYPIMHPSKEEASLWSGQYNTSARAYLSPEIANKMASAPVTSFSLLDRLKYTPSERDQGTCGNCWAWAGTGVMELDYARQKGVSDRFSLQYLDANYKGGCGTSGACCGGWLPDLVGFYQAKSIMVPWSNSNAHYRDGGQGCGACSLVSASTISTNPHYDLSDISVSTIPTQKLTKEEAISNIKNVLLQGKGIWFAYYLPDKSAWDNFYRFWGNEPESSIWQPDSDCGRSFNYKNGGGHAVLCVGYNETDPNNRYWIMLNSWGNTTGRPAGVFRMKMDMNYDCSYGDIGYAFYWMTLDMSYPQEDSLRNTASTSNPQEDPEGAQALPAAVAGANSRPSRPDKPQGSKTGTVQKSYSFSTSAIDPDGDDIQIIFDWGDGSTSQTEMVKSGTSVQMTHSWSQAGTYQIRVMARDKNNAESLWSTGKAVRIYVAAAPTKEQPAAGVKTEKAGQDKRTCPCLKRS